MYKQNNNHTIDELFLTLNTGEIYASIIRNTERVLIEKALACCFGNQIAAAKMLGINRNTIRVKIRKFNIDIAKFKL